MLVTNVLHIAMAFKRGDNAERRGAGYAKVARDLNQPGLILISEEFQGLKAMT
jgi:hypothetical protein